MAVLDDIKTLKSITSTDISQDGIFNIYIRKAVTLITTYLNLDVVPIPQTDWYTGIVTTIEPVDVATVYQDACLDYCMIQLNKRGNEGYKQFSQGSAHSGTYGNELPDSTVALLPPPYANMMSTRNTGVYYA